MPPGERKLFVLLVDLVGSQGLKERGAGTEKFKKAIGEFNTKTRAVLYAPMEITRGDEAAAVLDRLESLGESLRKFAATLRPLKCRFVVTHGVLTAGLTSKRSTEIDGPAFYQADREMRRLKKTRNTFRLETSKPPLDAALTSLINLALLREAELTDFQLQVIHLYGSDMGLTQQAIAKRVKRTQQQVQQVIKVVPFDALDEAWKTIERLLQELQGRIREKHDRARNI